MAQHHWLTNSKGTTIRFGKQSNKIHKELAKKYILQKTKC